LDLQFDTEHTILGDSAERFFADNYDFTARHGRDAPGIWQDDIWRQFAELGWLALPFAEEDGGLGAGMVEISILMEAFGRHLVIEPYLTTIVLAGGLITGLGTPEQKSALVPAIGAGNLRLAFAGGWGDDLGAATTSKSGAGYTLSGARKNVMDAPLADKLLVPANLDGGIGVFVIDADAPGVTIRGHRTTDGGYAGDVELAGIEVDAGSLLGGNSDAENTISWALDRAAAAISADAVGAIQKLAEETIEFTKTREQFGQSLSKFQVLQHRLVEMKVAEEEARAVTMLAILSIDAPDRNRMRAVSSAKSKTGRLARFVGQAAIQTHGAIGTTNELGIGDYVKRLMVYETILGATRRHTDRYAAIISDPDIAGAGLLLAEGA